MFQACVGTQGVAPDKIVASMLFVPHSLATATVGQPYLTHYAQVHTSRFDSTALLHVEHNSRSLPACLASAHDVCSACPHHIPPHTPSQDIVFEAGLEISAHILAVLPAAVVGLVCGVLGIGFVLLNVKVARLRDALLSGYKWRRCIEPCLLTVLYVTGTMLLPRLFPCTPTHCVTYNHQVYCGIQNVTAAAQGLAPPPNTPPLSLPLYTCSIMSEDTNSTWIPSSGTITPDTPSNVSAIVYYNELATLMLNTGEGEQGGGGLGSVCCAVLEATPCFDISCVRMLRVRTGLCREREREAGHTLHAPTFHGVLVSWAAKLQVV